MKDHTGMRVTSMLLLWKETKWSFFQTEGMSEKPNAADMSLDTSGEMFTEVNK